MGALAAPVGAAGGVAGVTIIGTGSDGAMVGVTGAVGVPGAFGDALATPPGLAVPAGTAAAVALAAPAGAAGGVDVAAAGALAAATWGGTAAAVGGVVGGVLVVDVAVAGELVVFRSDVHATTARSSSNAMTATIQVFRFIPAPCPVSGFGERTPHSSWI